MSEYLPSDKQWFVMRDLKRSNAKLPAYRQLGEMGFEVFTPMKTQISVRQFHKVRAAVPYLQDLLFVNALKADLDSVVDRTPTLQYRYVKGAPYCTPLIVRPDDMHRFMIAVQSTDKVRYYMPSEITPAMCGHRVRLLCDGPLEGMEGVLLSLRGSGKKRIIVELPGILAAAVEIDPDFIQLI